MCPSLKILSICCLIFGHLSAQIDSCSNMVKGKILDVETKEPIPYVSIKVKNTDKYTMTNISGEFNISGLCTNKNTLIISCFGYCDSICQDYHQHGKMRHIYLTQEVSDLETVTIQANKTKEEGTETISQISLERDQLKSNPTQSLATAISEEQGVSLISTGTNVQLPVIHGLYGNRILILNNGIKHGFQNWGTEHAPEIDINSTDNVTIIKGASGVRFGPDALGGAIIVESNPLYLNEAFYTELGTNYQTNGKGYNSHFQLGKGTKKWSYFINGNYTKIGDRHSPDYSLTNSGKEEYALGAGSRYHWNHLDIKLMYSYVNQNLGLLRTSIAESGNAFIKAINADEPVFIRPFSYEIGEPNQRTEHHFGKAEIDWWYTCDAKLTFRAGHQLNNRQEYDVRRNADRPIINLQLMTMDYQLEWKHPDWFKLDGLIGLQFFNQNNDNIAGTGVTPFIPNYNINRYSAFISESKRFGKNTLEAGLRLDYETNNVRGRETSQDVFRDEYSFINLTSSIGYLWKISDNTSFRTNIGTAWRSPNMAELYSFGQCGFKTSFGLLRYYTNDEGNLKTNKVMSFSESNIQPEIGYKFINEIEKHKGKNHTNLTFYSHYVENYIFDRPLGVFGTIRGPMPIFIFDQANAIFMGLDYSWERAWTKQLTATLGLSYLWSKNVSKNEPLIMQPPISINYDIKWQLPKIAKAGISELIIKPSYFFTQFQAPRTITPESLINGSEVITIESEIFDFLDAPESYFLLNISWNFSWEQITGGISINNLLDARYRSYLNEMRYFADEMGRNILFNLKYTFKSKKNN